MLTLGMALIPFGVVMFLLGLFHDGIEAPMPTAIGGALAWGGIGSACLGLVILAVEMAIGLERLWATAVRHLGS